LAQASPPAGLFLHNQQSGFTTSRPQKKPLNYDAIEAKIQKNINGDTKPPV
jgi:hypothetical protein